VRVREEPTGRPKGTRPRRRGQTQESGDAGGRATPVRLRRAEAAIGGKPTQPPDEGAEFTHACITCGSFCNIISHPLGCSYASSSNYEMQLNLLILSYKPTRTQNGAEKSTQRLEVPLQYSYIGDAFRNSIQVANVGHAGTVDVCERHTNLFWSTLYSVYIRVGGHTYTRVRRTL